MPAVKPSKLYLKFFNFKISCKMHCLENTQTKLQTVSQIGKYFTEKTVSAVLWPFELTADFFPHTFGDPF